MKSAKILERKNAVNLIGKRFSRLLVLSLYERTRKCTRWLCQCDCEKEKIILTHHLRSGETKSCGCYHRDNPFKTHGMKGTVEWHTWQTMIQRCENPNNVSWKHYGARGVKVCDRWKKFENFFSDMGYRPKDKHSIDRVDVNGDYEPSNCKWATWLEQRHNRRDSKK